jgi:DNA-binding transcriptional MocR family regulator
MDVSDDPSTLLYVRTAAKIQCLIDQGLFRPGERLPSIRGLSERLHLGINTARQAYIVLENAHRIEGRPRSGFYVSSTAQRTAGGLTAGGPATERPGTTGERALAPRRSASQPLLSLGMGSPNPELLPAVKLNRMLAQQGRKFPRQFVAYPPPNGVQRLRVQIAKRSMDCGCSFSADDVVVTSGCVEAVTLALRATCRPGDTVAVESPVYGTFLDAIQSLGLTVLEIPASADGGINVEVLRFALRENRIRACLTISNFNNPLGGMMPAEKKRQVVRLLARFGIPLIEDDAYGDLGFSGRRPPVFKSFDNDGLVLLCSSFSKTLAPGYRVGWIAAGRYQPRVQELKSLWNVATAAPTQLAIAEFLANGGYDRHLRSLRLRTAETMAKVRSTIEAGFPIGTRITKPGGGFVLWVEMPEGFDARALHARAQKEGIAIAPGQQFSLNGDFTHCFRINHSYWSEEIRRGLVRLGELTRERDRNPMPSCD